MRKEPEFRQYESDENPVAAFYRENHEQQTLEFARGKRVKYGALQSGKAGIWQTIERLNELIDASDPDTELSQIAHLLQTAEAARRDNRPDWFVLTALIHDLGKVLCLMGEPQWAVTGDTFPLGCPFDERVIYHEYFSHNPDSEVAAYQAPTGIYEPHCGLFNVTMSWGHDEYMYLVSNEYLPLEAQYIIRYHSFYAAHQADAYQYLYDDRDESMMRWVKAFNQYDLYSKADEPPNVATLKPYYEFLISRYFPTEVAW